MQLIRGSSLGKQSEPIWPGTAFAHTHIISENQRRDCPLLCGHLFNGYNWAI
jgi:hypothetical protein